MSIKNQLKKRGYSITDIARCLQVTQQAISAQLSSQSLPLHRLQDIARVVGCTPADLLSDDDTPTAAPSTTFAALIAVGGQTYQPRDVGELLQLAQRLSDDTPTAAGHQDEGGRRQPVRRRRPTSDASTTDTTTADHEDEDGND